jgi:hypothetical protein
LRVLVRFALRLPFVFVAFAFEWLAFAPPFVLTGAAVVFAFLTGVAGVFVFLTSPPPVAFAFVPLVLSAPVQPIQRLASASKTKRARFLRIDYPPVSPLKAYPYLDVTSTT